MKTKNNIIFLLLLLIFTSCGKETMVKYDNSNDIANGSAVRSWDTSKFPLIIHIPDTLATNYRTAIENAGKSWNDSLGATLGKEIFVFVYDNSPNLQPASQSPKPSLYFSLGDHLQGLYRQDNWSFKEDTTANTLASTVTLTQSGRIIEGDILFNFSRYNFSNYENAQAGTNYIDMESVMVHELGHFIGLGHVDTATDPNSIMNPNLGVNSKRRVLSSGDKQRINDLYLSN